MRRGEVIAIGSELLLGGRPDTNSLFLTEALAAVGVEVRFKSVVGDDEADIMAAIRTASRRAEVVVLTGGLGPTGDDLTRQAVARVTRRLLRRRAEAVEGMRQRLAAWGRTPSVAQMRQGLIPSGAEVIANPVGSAPGFCLTWNRCFLVALPGVPAEARGMFMAGVVPRLAAERASHRLSVIERRLLHTFGVAESDIEQRIKNRIPVKSGVRLGLQASPLGVTVSLTASGERGTLRGENKGARLLDRVLKDVQTRLGSCVYAEGSETMEQVVGRLLASRGLTLAVAESCTGGLIGHRLTQVPGSSAYLDRVVVCYSDQAKTELLDVPAELLARYGAVSEEVARAMASGIRARSQASIGVSVTGIAGPGGGTTHKPVGLVFVALDADFPQGPKRRRNRTRLAQEFRFHGDRDTIKLRASQATMDVLRRCLIS